MSNKNKIVQCSYCEWSGRSDKFKIHVAKHQVPQVPQVPLKDCGCEMTDTIMFEGKEIPWKPWYDIHYFESDSIPHVKIVRKIKHKA